MYGLTIEMPNTKHIITVYSDGEELTALAFDTVEPDRPDRICREAARQLSEYFDKKRREFSLPYKIHGGEFFCSVMKTVSGIPYGKTLSYGQLAFSAGYPRAARAAGTALSKNPLPIIIPCHRILPASGGVGNYFGGRLNDVKEYLLKLEGII